MVLPPAHIALELELLFAFVASVLPLGKDGGRIVFRYGTGHYTGHEREFKNVGGVLVHISPPAGSA